MRFSPLSKTREFSRRDFAGRPYQSVMEAAANGRLIEHFGPFDLCFGLTATARGLRWSLQAWRFFRIPLPKFSTPTIECFEGAGGDAFTFDIDVIFPLVGQVVHYAGALREAPDAAPVWLYDSFCALCSWSVRYTLAREVTPSIRFVAIQSAEGRALAGANGVDCEDPNTLLFIENWRVLKKSEALFALARQLQGPARLAILARLLPQPIRDLLYDLIARNRYHWFGRLDKCAVPDSAIHARFAPPENGPQSGRGPLR